MRRLLTGLFMALLGACIGGCDRRPAPRPTTDATPTARPPVVLVSIDTLRSDRLPVYGYDQVETPAVDALVADGIVFRHAFTHVPLTLPAHTSMLTGLLPPQHGVRENMGYVLDGPAHPSMPRRLRELGYRTGAAVSAMVLRGETGLAEGFEVYEDELVAARTVTQVTSPRRTGGTTLEAIDDWLESVHTGAFFLFFHLYEPHRPFEAPEPFASQFSDPYDAEVANADAVVGRLFDRLRSLGVYDDAVVILTSDHGEGLGDHGDPEHGPLLYREVLQIPLVVKLPRNQRAGEVVDAPAQLIDLYPTVLDVLGLELPNALPGASLLGLETGEMRSLYGETYFPRLHFGWSDLASIIEYPYHLISGPDPELFDLAADPAERNNILEQKRAEAFRLRQALEAANDDFQAPGAVDPATRQMLAALGYVGAVARGDGPLADPKTRMHVIRTLGSAFRQYRDRDFTRAAESYRRVLVDEPEVYDAWLYLGHSLMQLQRPHEALSAFEEALRLTSGAPSVAAAVAGALGALGRFDEARPLAETAIADNPAVYDLLAQIAVKQGDLEGAERYVQRALDGGNSSPGLLIAQADILVARERYEEAITVTEAAERAIPAGADRETYRGLFAARGRAYANMGEAEPAELAFLEEIRHNPGTLPAYSELALLYALVGEPDRVSGVLRQMLEQNPGPAAYDRAASTLRILGDSLSADALLTEARRRWPDDPRLK